MPSLRMTNIGGVRRISIVAGACPLRNGTLRHTCSKTPPDGGVLQILSKKYYFFDKEVCGLTAPPDGGVLQLRVSL